MVSPDWAGVPTISFSDPNVPQAPPLSVAEARVSTLEAMPDSASTYSVRESMVKEPFASKLVDPPPVAATPLTVSCPPVGAELSGVNERTVDTAFPAASRPTTVWLLGVAPDAKAYALDV